AKFRLTSFPLYSQAYRGAFPEESANLTISEWLKCTPVSVPKKAIGKLFLFLGLLQKSLDVVKGIVYATHIPTFKIVGLSGLSYVDVITGKFPVFVGKRL